MAKKDVIIGRLEPVSFPQLGIANVLAKVDTGAYSGALHCSHIKVVKRGKNRQKSLRFYPLGQKALAQETTEFKEVHVRSSNGHKSKRYIIVTTIVLNGKEYTTKIGLSERSVMKREVLLGRRFLRENNIIVDVRINSELDDEGEDI